MKNDLYFIPILAKAFDDRDPKKAFIKAIDEIKLLGQKPEYATGFDQFQTFIREAENKCEQRLHKEISSAALEELVVLVATGAFEHDQEGIKEILSFIEHDKTLLEEFNRIRSDILTPLKKTPTLELVVLRNNEILKTIPLLYPDFVEKITDITPDNYAFELSTGRVLWAGELTEQDLMWAHAYPGDDLKLAATTEEEPKEPTREILLFGGHLILRFFAGIETGWIEIVAKDLN